MKHLGLILVLSILLSIVAPGILVLGEEQTLLVIRKEIKFNITVIAGDDDNGTTRTVILVLDFYFINAEPSSSDVNISFPVTIRIGDRIINKTVVVPLRIRGELEKIVVVSVREETSSSTSSSEESSEEIIVYYPGTSGPVASNTTFPGQTESPGGSSGVEATRTVTKTITKTKTITMGALSQQGTTTQPTTSPRGSIGNTESPGTGYAGILPGVLLGGLLGAIVVVVLAMLLLMRRRPPEETRREEAPTTPQQSQQMVQPETPTQGETRPQIPRLKCPVCGEIVEPIITDDNRLVCPACHAEIGRIREDETLELATPKDKAAEETSEEAEQETNEE